MTSHPAQSHLHAAQSFTRGEIRQLLDCRGDELHALYQRADDIRKAVHGDAIPIRAIIEISNQCANQCLYCGIRAEAALPRYRMTEAEILHTAEAIVATGLAGTLVLQGGECGGHTDDEIRRLLIRLKVAAPALAITLSLGNRPADVYAAWQAAGMERYLLRFETRDDALFARLHPDCTLTERLACLQTLQALGIQTGTGFMIGLPGETKDILTDNLLFCRDGHFDMLGIGPFIPAADTPLAGAANAYPDDPEMPWRVLAILRVLNPMAHIPATTALDAIRPDGRLLALQRGANVFMPNATPAPYKAAYQLYAGKPVVDGDWQDDVRTRLTALHRSAATGPAHALRLQPFNTCR